MDKVSAMVWAPWKVVAPVTVKDGTVKAPDSVVAPVTERVPPIAVLPVKVAAPATERVEAREAAPWTVKVDSKVEGDLDKKVSLLLPPKEAELEDRLVKEPNWPEKDLPDNEPVAEMELVER